ncbi:25708_t:CDS:2, partial [Gigaspora margarita]
VRILNNWHENVGYSYQIKTIQNKQQLEQKMIKFVCGMYQLRNGDEYAPSSLYNAINCGKHGEMRVLQFIFTQNSSLQFTKFFQKNDQGWVNSNLDSLIIPVSPDPEGLLGPVYDIKLYIKRRPNKWYHNMRLGIKTCGNLMKSICKSTGIDIQGHNI